MHRIWIYVCIVVLLLATAVIVAVIWFLPERISGLGHFEGQVVVKWLDDGRRMELIKDFAYVDPEGKIWGAPAGAVVDGASIPKAFWSIIGGPFEGKYRNASVVHDVACVQRKESSDDVHLMFYRACRCGGVEEKKAKTVYAAVYFFGPKWAIVCYSRNDGKSVREVRSIPASQADEKTVEYISKFIDAKNPSLEEIRQLEF